MVMLLVALGAAIFIAGSLCAVDASAQISLIGEWSPRYHEDFPDRIPGPELGDVDVDLEDLPVPNGRGEVDRDTAARRLGEALSQDRGARPGYAVAPRRADHSSGVALRPSRMRPVVLPGDPLTSVLVMLIEGRADPSLKMPHGNAKPLEPREIAIIRKWVEEGAKNN